MKTDVCCSACGYFLGRRLTPKRVANLTSVIFAILMVVFLVTVAIPQTQGPQSNDFGSIVAHNVATNGANYVFILGAIIVGQAIGWVVGVVVCRSR
jgi:hypothetical protein